MDWGRRELLQIQGAENQLRQVLNLHLENICRDRELATVFQVEMRHSARFLKETSRPQLRDYLQGIQRILDQGKEEGCFRSDLDTWFSAKCIFALLDEAATSWVLSDRDYPLLDSSETIMNFIMNGMACPKAD